MSGNPLKRAAVALFTLGSFFVPAGALALLASAASPQYGTIIREQKLASASGNLGPILGNDFRFGVSVADLGDFDGDGVHDLLAGAHRANRGGTERGAVWLLLLNANGTVKQRHEISAVAGGLPGPIEDNDRFGISACALGDLDLDGTTDIAVGAYRDDDGGFDHGAVYVLFLNPNGTVKAQQKISDTSGGLAATLEREDSFGWSLEPIGDLDGDGILDLAVGATRDDGSESDLLRDYGAVYLLQLLRDGTVKATTRLAADTPPLGAALRDGDRFGADVALLGDLDGDGVEDIAVGAFGDDPLKSGRVFVMALRTNGTVKSFTEIGAGLGGFTGALDTGDRFGISLASGDLDGDGIQDLLVGAVGDDDGGADAGALWVLKLDVTGRVTGHEKISPGFGGFGGLLRPGDNFGVSCDTLGDVDRDGAIDLAVGAYQDDEGGFDRGAVWTLFRAGMGVPVADFGATPTQGAAPLAVQFDDQSQGVITAWSWDFGDGSGSSAPEPVHVFAPGIYDVSLIVSGPNGTHTKTRAGYVVSEDLAPGAAFTADATTGFAPHAVQFGDASTGLVTARSWDFGDGATSNLEDPSHTFGAPGSYTVTLTVSGPYGLDTETRVEWIVVEDPQPMADFVALPGSGYAPLAVLFQDLSRGLITSWSWDFGDGASSSEAEPTHLYEAVGSYDVTLTVAGPTGADTLFLAAAVVANEPPPTADFEPSVTSGFAPLTLGFTSQSSGTITSYAWDFGDGSGSSDADPAHTYAAHGVYTVALTVANPSGSDTEIKSELVTVLDPAPRAGFTRDVEGGFVPLTVAFTDSSDGLLTAWAWEFGDGATSSERNPVHAYTSIGSYLPRLTISGPSGTDVHEAATPIVVAWEPPVAEFTHDVVAGFAPLGVQFTDQSAGDVTQWAWSFGDGESSDSASPAHVYTVPGTHSVTLTATGPAGSDTEIKSELVTVLDPAPRAGFTRDIEGGFVPLTVAFTDSSEGLLTAWAWEFGDGATSAERDPVHTYTAAGSYLPRLTISGPSGTDVHEAATPIVVAWEPPVAEFTHDVVAGFAPLGVQFTDQSTGDVTQWAWSFGDGESADSASPAHVYTVPGTHSVTLTATGPAGSDTEIKSELVTVLDPAPRAGFMRDVEGGFVPLTVAFTDSSEGLLTAWAWDFGDGATSAERDPVHTYTAAGSYLPRLTISGPTGTDVHEAATPIVVAWEPPVAEFTGDVVAGVAPLGVQFTDQSAGDVTQWAWSFGDGASASSASPAHVYTVPGTYSVTLTASGPAGSDAETKSALVLVEWPAPVAAFDAGPRTGFAPLSVAFADLSTGNITSWSWNFGDGTSARARHPLKNFTRAGNFMVTLTAKGPGGSHTFTQGPITVQTRPTLLNGGFESTAVGARPATPWSVAGGSEVFVTDQLDSGFPREGVRYCEISANGSTNALPPSNPGGEGSLPVRAVRLTRGLTFETLAPVLVFDAALLLGELQDTLVRNDFLSVDVSDGTRHVNVFLADSFADFAQTSTRRGLPMTAPRRVVADLRLAFPGIVQSTPLSLQVSVGNGGSGGNSSYGYVDGFRLAPVATASFRNGTGRNTARYVAGPAVLGGSWNVSVDVTGHAGASAIQLVGTLRPAAGTLRTSGELLVSGRRIFAQSWLATPGVNERTFVLPLDNALIGAFMATQATITGGVSEVTNAYDLVLGF